MPPSEKHSRRRRHSPKKNFAAPEAAPPTPWLVAATDLGLLAALWLVPLCLGGRLAIGQGVLLAAAVWTAGCWSLHQVVARESRWIWTRCEWLWFAATGLVVLQLTALPEDWLEWLSPKTAEVLSEWTDSSTDVMTHRWATISLAPQETRSSLATFLAYGLLFFVAVQRCREQRDIERLLKWIVVATVSVAVFSLVQFAFSNGKFYGVFQHPFSDPRNFALGPFTNRNHLAQFVTLGVGPLWWWWLTASKGEPASATAKSFAAPSPNAAQMTVVHMVAMSGLTLIVLAVLLSQSRGGVVALAVASVVGLWGFHLAKLLSPQFVLGLMVALVTIGGIGWLAGSAELARRIDSTAPESRWPIWQANFDIARDFAWVGTGVGTHVHAHQLYLDRRYTGREFTHADNSYLQVASECGMAGICIGGLMLLTCLNWGWGVLRRKTETSSTAIAAALFASLMANAVHAVFDFLWYVPGLVVVVLLLGASARRLSQLDLVAEGRSTPQLPLPRLCWGLAGSGLALLAPWMWAQKADSIAAEPHRLRYLNLVFAPEAVYPVDDEEPETERILLKEKSISAVRAGKADLHDGQVQLTAALAYRQMFDTLQEQGDNPMTLAQLRDAVQASEFTSLEQLHAWFDAAAGKNVRLLDAAWKSALRSIEEAPLEGSAYVCLAELSFLHDPAGKLQQRLLNQALLVRPYDPNVLFAAGQEALLLGDEERGLTLWKRAFGYAPSFQKRISDILAVDKSAEFFCETFSPDWQSKGHICDSFRALGREEELHKMLRLYAEAAMEDARLQTIEAGAAQRWIAARGAWMELQEPERAIACLKEGARKFPHSQDLRLALGMDLFHQERYAEAADHLRWAATRNPDNAALQDAAKRAIRASLKSAPAASRVSTAGYER